MRYPGLYYRLDDDHNPVLLPTLEDAMPYLEARAADFDRHCRVARTKVGKWDVSTVFLGTPHWGPDGHDTALFETMVFGGDGEMDHFDRRYPTWDQAVEGHDKVVEDLLSLVSENI